MAERRDQATVPTFRSPARCGAASALNPGECLGLAENAAPSRAERGPASYLRRQSGRSTGRTDPSATLTGTTSQPRSGQPSMRLPVAVASQVRRTATAISPRHLGHRRPARLHQHLLALPIGSVAMHELPYRQTLLEVHSIHRHGASSSWTRSSSALGGSQREPAEVHR